MRFDPKDYFIPKSIESALQYISRYKGQARVIAGGTTFYELAQRGLLSHVERLVDITKLGLNYVREGDREVKIGAATTLSQLLEAEALDKPEFAAIGDVVRIFHPSQVANVATVGGGICAAVPLFDMPTALLALSAQLATVGPSGKRKMPIRDFWLGYFSSVLQDDEILYEIELPKSSLISTSAFGKIGRMEADFAVVNVATRLGVQDQKIRDCLVAAGNLIEKPIRLENSEKALLNMPIDGDLPESFYQDAEKINPDDQVHASAWYKKEVLKVLMEQTFNTCRSRINTP